MKIAVIADPINNQNAGVHIYTKHLVDELIRQKENHEIVIVSEKRIDDLDCHQIVIPNTRLPIGFASLRLFILVPLVLILEKVDVVIEPAHFGPWNLPRRIRRVTVIHDMTPLLFPQHHRWHSQMLQRIFLKRILEKTDVVITNSDNTSKDVMELFPGTQGKVHRTYLGIDPSYQPTQNRNLVDKLPFDTSNGYFHFVGTIEPRKGLTSLIEAYSLFRKETKAPIPLIICGAKGWKTDEIFEAHQTSPYQRDIHFLGFVDQKLIIQLHSHSLALIYPSMYEGFGFPIVEALACGGRVITCDNSSLTEVGGQFVDYFSYGDVLTLSQLMSASFKSKASIETKNDRIAWVRQFNWKNHVESILRVLES